MEGTVVTEGMAAVDTVAEATVAAAVAVVTDLANRRPGPSGRVE